MTQVQTNVAISATTRDQRIRELTNEALSDYEDELRDACQGFSAHLGTIDDPDDRSVFCTWFTLINGSIFVDVRDRLHRLGVFQ